MSKSRTPDVINRPLQEVIGESLPFLRRHARALTGAQSRGDQYAAAALETILNDPDSYHSAPLGGRGALFSVFYHIWQSTGGAFEEREDATRGARGEALRHLAKLTPRSRDALLLHTVEDFTIEETGKILGVGADEANELVEIARREMQDASKGRVMIIEDESVIAMDLAGLVGMMGHHVTGIATTAEEAVALGREQRPDLILADIQLADGSNGIDAVNTLMDDLGEVAVIFITAFPERLLTGERPEPAFMISKPYSHGQVLSAVSQAIFFASTETLKM
jgi:DNA-directed RNA polymerase specialized sigma24 family protein